MKVKLTFHESKDEINMKQMKQYLKSKLGIYTRFDIVAKNSGRGKDVAKREAKTFVLLTCRKKRLSSLIASSPELKLMYPSFKKARHITRKAHKPPKGKKLIQLSFADEFHEWGKGRALELIQRIAKLTGVPEDSIELVGMRPGSVVVVLRVPEPAAEVVMKESTEGLKVQFPTLRAFEPTEESTESIEDLVEQMEESAISMCKCTDVVYKSDQLAERSLDKSNATKTFLTHTFPTRRFPIRHVTSDPNGNVACMRSQEYQRHIRMCHIR